MKTININKIVNESIQKVIEEENEKTNKIVDLISFLHNAQLPVREIHWNTRVESLHSTTNDFINDLFNWEDTMAESFIGSKNIDLKINDTKPSDVEGFNKKHLTSILNELVNLTTEIKNSLNDSDNGICAVIDDILEKSNKYLYKKDFE